MDKTSGFHFLEYVLFSLLIIAIIFFALKSERDLKVQTESIESTIRQVHQDNEDLSKISKLIFELSNTNERQNTLISEQISDIHENLKSKIELTHKVIRDSGDLLNESFQNVIESTKNENIIDNLPVINVQERETVLEKAFNEGFTLYSEKKYGSALSIFKDAVSLYPFDSELWYYYLSCLYQSDPENIGNFEYLKGQLDLYTYDKQFSENSLLILAEISLTEDDLEQALEIYRQLYVEDETNLQYLRSQGMIEFQLGEYNAAINSYKSYLHSYPNDYEVLYFNGISLYNRGFYEEALEQFYLAQKSEKPYGNINKKIDETLEKMENSK